MMVMHDETGRLAEGVIGVMEASLHRLEEGLPGGRARYESARKSLDELTQPGKELGDIEKLESQVSGLAEDAPGCVAVQYLFSDVLLSLGQASASAAETNDSVEMAAYALEKYRGAIDALQTAMGLLPEDRKHRLEFDEFRGVLRLSLGRAYAAKGLFVHSLSSRGVPTVGDDWHELFRKADIHYRAIESRAIPVGAAVAMYYSLGKIGLALREPSRTAASYFEKVLALDPDYKDASRLLDMAQRMVDEVH